MNVEDLVQTFRDAERAEKYVWLKHRLDPNPICDSFNIGENGRFTVGLYLSYIDDYEGRQVIGPEDVEWAHVSSRTLVDVMRERLNSAKRDQTLVRLVFADIIEPQLIRHSFYTREGRGTILYGHLVHEPTLE